MANINELRKLGQGKQSKDWLANIYKPQPRIKMDLPASDIAIAERELKACRKNYGKRAQLVRYKTPSGGERVRVIIQPK